MLEWKFLEEKTWTRQEASREEAHIKDEARPPCPFSAATSSLFQPSLVFYVF